MDCCFYGFTTASALNSRPASLTVRSIGLWSHTARVHVLVLTSTNCVIWSKLPYLSVSCCAGLSSSVNSNSLQPPWMVAHQTPLSKELSRQKYWSRLPFPTSGDLPVPRIKPMSRDPRALTGGLYHCSTWKAPLCPQCLSFIRIAIRAYLFPIKSEWVSLYAAAAAAAAKSLQSRLCATL